MATETGRLSRTGGLQDSCSQYQATPVTIAAPPGKRQDAARGTARPRRASSHGSWWLQARFRLVSTTRQWSHRLAHMRKHPRTQRRLPTGSGTGWIMSSVLSARACADWLPTSSAITSACCAISIAALVLAAEQWIAFRVPRRLHPRFLG